MLSSGLGNTAGLRIGSVPSAQRKRQSPWLVAGRGGHSRNCTDCGVGGKAGEGWGGKVRAGRLVRRRTTWVVQAGGGRSLGMVWRHGEADGLKTYLGKNQKYSLVLHY